jgi:hypothetical protein
LFHAMYMVSGTSLQARCCHWAFPVAGRWGPPAGSLSLQAAGACGPAAQPRYSPLPCRETATWGDAHFTCVVASDFINVPSCSMLFPNCLNKYLIQFKKHEVKRGKGHQEWTGPALFYISGSIHNVLRVVV